MERYIFLFSAKVEDDVSVVTAKTAGKKRKYSENALDVMSLKSQSTSKYRGKFTNFFIKEVFFILYN